MSNDELVNAYAGMVEAAYWWCQRCQHLNGVIEGQVNTIKNQQKIIEDLKNPSIDTLVNIFEEKGIGISFRLVPTDEEE